MKTLKHAVETALDCQDACNLSGVLFAYAQAMKLICDESNRCGHGTDWRNKHGINLLFIDKLCHLSGYTQSFGIEMDRAYRECMALAER